MLVKILLSTEVKNVNFIVSLFWTIFKCRIIFTFLFLAFEHERFIENHFSVNRYSMKICYWNNIFNNGFNNFNTWFLWFVRVLLSVRPCVMWRPFIWNSVKISWLASAWCSFLEKGTYLWADFHFSLNVNVNVTVVSYINSNICETKIYNFYSIG